MDIGGEWHSGVGTHLRRPQRDCFCSWLRIPSVRTTKKGVERGFVPFRPRILGRSMDDFEQWHDIHSAFQSRSSASSLLTYIAIWLADGISVLLWYLLLYLKASWVKSNRISTQ